MLFLYLLIIITNGYIYDNELCSSDNWMSVEGDSWSFDNESCSATNNISRHNMAMLIYKQWPFVTYAQNTSYRFEIEYNFTIIAMDTDEPGPSGSVGIVWYPDSEVIHYIGLSFRKNEAFSGYSNGMSIGNMYDNSEWDIDANYSMFWYNKGALPFNISTDTFYSMYISISIRHDHIFTYMTVNDQHVLSYSTYPEPLGKNNTNTSWIGLKNRYCSVKSHSLSVLEPTVIDDGQYIIQRLKSWGAWRTTTQTPITSETSTFATNASSSPRTENEAEAEDLESTYSATEPPVSDVFDLWWLNMTILWILVAAIIGCLFCCCLTIIYLQLMPKKVAKKKSVINMLSMISNQSTKGEGVPSVVVEKEPDLERVITGEGMKRNPLCTKCNTVMNDAEMCHTKGMIYCTKCSVEYMEDSDEDSVNMQGTTRTPAAGEGLDQNTLCIACNMEINNEEGVEYCNDCRVIMLPKKGTMDEPKNKNNSHANKVIMKPENINNRMKGKEDMNIVHKAVAKPPEQMTIEGAKMTENKNNPVGDRVIMKPKETKYKSTKKTKRTNKNERGNNNDRCVDCGARKKGKEDPETGLFHCNKCWEERDESDSDEMYIEHKAVTKSPKGNKVMMLQKKMTIEGPKMTENKKNPDGDRVIMKPKGTKYKSTKNELENKNNRCIDCGARKKGKEDPETGLFHCNKCWEIHAESDSEEMYIEHETVTDGNTVNNGTDLRICGETGQ